MILTESLKSPRFLLTVCRQILRLAYDSFRIIEIAAVTINKIDDANLMRRRPANATTPIDPTQQHRHN